MPSKSDEITVKLTGTGLSFDRKVRANLGTTVKRLVDNIALVHDNGKRLFLTKAGIREVERRKLHHPE